MEKELREAVTSIIKKWYAIHGATGKPEDLAHAIVAAIGVDEDKANLIFIQHRNRFKKLTNFQWLKKVIHALATDDIIKVEVER